MMVSGGRGSYGWGGVVWEGDCWLWKRGEGEAGVEKVDGANGEVRGGNIGECTVSRGGHFLTRKKFLNKAFFPKI